jgi:hypothetical protein
VKCSELCKCAINPITNPNHVYSHTHTRDNKKKVTLFPRRVPLHLHTFINMFFESLTGFLKNLKIVTVLGIMFYYYICIKISPIFVSRNTVILQH